MTSPRIIITTLESAGAALPDAITAAAEQFDRVTAASAQLHGTTGMVPTYTLAALDAGRDPFADPKVQQAVVADHLAQIKGTTQVDSLAADRFREILHEHIADVMKALQDVVDTAAAAVQRAAKSLGGADPADPTAVLSLGGRAAEAWGQHQVAAKQLDAINTARGLIAQTLHWSEPGNRMRSLRWAALTAAQIDDYGSAAPETMVRAGITLALADAAEMQRRTRAIEAEHQAADNDLERRRKNELRTIPIPA